ncbi:hypothetical protein ILUMI_18585 [Ignelater luminosus]|uniref:HTH CENPB-type domain-containing protein n=1 Tax=Ignelater luminosus TaxID=2038154 RepID=A0A8K0CHQ5_IGNLU|nr:hypothetical protein ILUMI_18585 [Ignelater luminosus]
MPRILQRKLGSRPYKDYSKEQLKKAIDAKKHMGKVGRLSVFNEETENTIVRCIAMCADWGFPLTTLDIRLIVKSYMDQHGYTKPRFKNNLPGYDWVKAFIIKHKDTIIHRLCQNLIRSRARVDSEMIKKYFDEVGITLNGVEPHLIINYGETNFTDDPKKTKVIVRRKSRHPDRTMDASKSSVSVMFSAVGDGFILPPYVVYKAEHFYSTWTTGGPKGTDSELLVLNANQSVTTDNVDNDSWANSFENYLDEARKKDTQSLRGRKKKLNLSPGRSIVDSMLEAGCSNTNLFPRKRAKNVFRSEQYSVHDFSSDERFVSSDERPSDKEDDNGVDNTQRQVTKESLQPVNVTMDQLIEDQTFVVMKLMYNASTKQEVAKYFIVLCKKKTRNSHGSLSA